MKLYKPATTQYTLKDADKSNNYHQSINLLANHKIAIAKEYLKPTDNVIRAHFALFLSRTARKPSQKVVFFIVYPVLFLQGAGSKDYVKCTFCTIRACVLLIL
jgi:hypothetical protein